MQRHWFVRPLAVVTVGLVAQTALAATYATVSPQHIPAPQSTSLLVSPATSHPTSPLVSPVTSYLQGPGPHDTYCMGGVLNACLDVGGLLAAVVGAIGKLLNDAVVSLFGHIEHTFGDAFDTLTAPFTRALTYTPDITAESSWAVLRNLETTLQQLAGVLFVGFLTIGVFGAYLGSIGVGDFAQIIGPVRRAALVTGFIAGYKQLMGTGFAVLNGVTGFIVGASSTQNESAWTALRGALIMLHDAVSLTGIIDVVIVALGLILALLCVVVRMMGLGLLAALYVVGPLALVTWLSPQFDFIARWWVRTFLSVALWPLGYAVGLKVIVILLAGGGPLSEFGGLASGLGALGLLGGLYRVPAIIGSMVGAGSTLLGTAASTVTDAAVGTSVALATRAIGRTFVPGP